ncbi:MAG: DUF1674 domain-containing protein [Alphaproteobacteria bacterium RIFCSPHIGHO2_12_FULL_63_12]|nr:MAG: DUF1674 domain-containing protein [Alphaproteobacteria bacterium RIFCSPHIGHO2_12_FULL_63_12]
MSEKIEPTAAIEGAAPGAALSPAAQRALEEAAARRKAATAAPAPAEKGGPSGPEPTRYGDWERKGRAVDF